MSWVDPQWQEKCSDKLESPDRAVRRIRSGHHVFIGSGCAEPQTLVRALTTRGHELADLQLMHILTLGIAPYAETRFQETFRHNAFFIGPNVRDAVAEGRADYTPIFLSEVPGLFARGRLWIDVALIQVTPPDEHGYCSYGVSVDIVKSAAEHAGLVIAEVNTQMPRTLGDSFLHVRDIDVMVLSDVPILETQHPEPDEIAVRIGEHIAGLIEDGSCLQMGIGTIPDAVLAQLGNKLELGIHTEMFAEGVIPLLDGGVITNRQKSINPGKLVASFIMGTRRLYDFVDNNPLCEFHPTEYTNDPYRIAQNDKVVAINAALEVDLTGQVCADSLGTYFYSGIGGQVDFTRGAARSRGGKPIIALPSTAEHGQDSRIVSTLAPGAGVVTSRGDVHYVVTEWGVADLYGKSVRERALALINVAHPDFRGELLAAAKGRHFVPMDQIEPPLHGGIYPEEYETTCTAKNGTVLDVRPIRSTDEDALRDFHHRCGAESLYYRFMAPQPRLPHAKAQFFANVDYRTRIAIVLMQHVREHEEIVGVARYALDPATNFAEVAFLIADAWQNQGLGRFLLRYLTHIAKQHHIEGFTAEVVATNHRMRHLFETCGYPVQVKLEQGVYSMRIPFTARPPDAEATDN